LYDNIPITRNAHDSNFCAANPKFVAIVTEVAGGGAFVVLPINKVLTNICQNNVISISNFSCLFGFRLAV